MCLLIVLSRVVPGAPLVVGANRDEALARPALPMVRLGESPRVLGGRDLLAGGTWLAVSEHGVVAALTNQPISTGRDPTKRSRGELPLLLALHPTAAEAARVLAARIDPLAYNPCWLLVGDRHSLHYLAVGDGPLVAEELPPGVWVLENRPLHVRSSKAAAVHAAVDEIAGRPIAEVLERLAAVQRSHAIPDGSGAAPPRDGGPQRPPELEAPCVHLGGPWAGEGPALLPASGYGTRWAARIVVPAEAALPSVQYADGAPCTHPFLDATPLWTDAPR